MLELLVPILFALSGALYIAMNAGIQDTLQTDKKMPQVSYVGAHPHPQTSLFCSLVFQVASTAAVASTSKVSTAAKSTTAQILHWKTKFPPPCQSDGMIGSMLANSFTSPKPLFASFRLPASPGSRLQRRPCSGCIGSLLELGLLRFSHLLPLILQPLKGCISFHFLHPSAMLSSV